MRRLVLPLAVLILSGPAFGQDIAEETTRDLWCGIAFDLAARDVPVDAAPEVLTVTEPYRQGAQMLIGRAKAVHLESGYTEETFEDLRAQTEAEIATELASTDPAVEPKFSFEDCAALLGL